MELDERARSAFDSGLYCAESVVASVAEHYGIDSPLLPRIATGFCSGMARSCGTCGAVSGAVLSLNLLLGRDGAEQGVEENYRAVQTLVEQFRQRFGATECAQLLGCDLGTPEGQERFRRDNLRERCSDYTTVAARLVGEILEKR